MPSPKGNGSSSNPDAKPSVQRRRKKRSKLSKDSKGPGRPAGSLTWPQIRRVRIAHEELLKGPVSCARLLELDGTAKNRKTIMDAIRIMRCELGLPVEICEDRSGYFYTKPVESLPLLLVTEDELMALCMMRLAVEPYRGSCFHEVLDTVFGKLLQQAGPVMADAWKKLSKVIFFRTTRAERMPDVNAFMRLVKACIEHEEMEFLYRKPDATAKELRRVQPLWIECVDHTRYVRTFVPKRKERRTFKIGRMDKLQGTERFFEELKDLHPEEEFANVFGIYSSDEDPVDVRIRFHNGASQRVREGQWHGSQVFTPTRPGGKSEPTELAMHVGVTPELVGWILGWGRDAQVISPQSLRDAVKEEARAILEM